MTDHFSDQTDAYLKALYKPDDLVTLRPIETWTENNRKQSRVLYNQIVTDEVKNWLQGELAHKIEEISADEDVRKTLIGLRVVSC